MRTDRTAPDELAYYWPETNLFSALAQDFAKTGQLHPEELYLILDWKASRARTHHVHRLTELAGSFDKAASEIATDIWKADTPDQCLGVLMTKWGFLLPTASAILTVLFPDKFTIYDRRVCKALGDFDKLANWKWSDKLWQEYQRLIAAVQSAAPSGLSLRNCDRWLWGRDKREVMLAELGV